MPSGMRRAWLIATAAMLAICLLTIWQSLLLPLTDRLGPGPGFFPFWLASIGAVLAAMLLLRIVLSPADGNAAAAILPRGKGVWQIVAVLAALGLVAGMMEWLGFRLSMLLFVAGLVIVLGERRWWAVVLFAGAGSFGVYYVFNDWLDVVLPVSELVGI